MVKKVLVADVGGTNTTLGVFNFNDSSLSNIKKIKTNDLDIESELNNYKDLEKLAGASIAVAGPVKLNSVSMTNFNKNFSSKALSKKSNLDVLLINDFEALGFYVKNNGFKKILIVGAGTGLGKVFVLDDVIPSEGGNQDFPFARGEDKLKDFFFKKLKRIPEYEDLVSGRGASLLKDFYSKKRLSSGELDPEFIFSNKDDSLNKLVISSFSKFYGRFIKNSNADFLPEKIFVAGGIARKNPWILKSSDFLSELQHRYLKKPKIILLKDKYAALIGAGVAFKHKNI
ncbi:MAG: glucokinase [Candidatus Woesearchaeota archaeon]